MVRLFLDAAGRAWRTYDVSRDRAGRLREVAKSFAAPYRLFVAEDGEWRLYEFRRGEVRDVDAERLQAQLGRSRAATGACDA